MVAHVFADVVVVVVVGVDVIGDVVGDGDGDENGLRGRGQAGNSRRRHTSPTTFTSTSTPTSHVDDRDG